MFAEDLSTRHAFCILTLTVYGMSHGKVQRCIYDCRITQTNKQHRKRSCLKQPISLPLATVHCEPLPKLRQTYLPASLMLTTGFGAKPAPPVEELRKQAATSGVGLSKSRSNSL